MQCQGDQRICVTVMRYSRLLSDFEGIDHQKTTVTLVVWNAIEKLCYCSRNNTPPV